MMKKIGLALLSSLDKVDVSDQLVVNVIPCIHYYFQQIMVHGI